jgi:hypothetical protein
MSCKLLRSKASFWKLSIVIGLTILLVAGIALLIYIVSTFNAAKRPISYLPEINPGDLYYAPPGDSQFELMNSYFRLLANRDGNVEITTLDGETIISGFKFYSFHENEDERIGFKAVVLEMVNDSTLSIKGNGHSGEHIIIDISALRDKPKLNIRIKISYEKSTAVIREALIIKFDIPVSEVYKKNRQIDTLSIEKEYWLDKQGIKFGKGRRAATIYNTTSVSSLQVDTENNLLYVNLDYHMDHPHINIPYQQDGGRKWVDLSSSAYNEATERENSFSIWFGEIPETIPRLMLMPYGFISAYVFTEHADEADIRTQRAVYFGSEIITEANQATGGFMGNRIPVTKSVFYSNPNDSLNISILDTDDGVEFIDFLDQLDSTGLYDICLHTPDFLNSNRTILEKSIAFMKERYNTVTWIDHGCYSGKENRESFVCDGFNSGSDFYVADLWQKYNTLYFWNTAVELHLKKINSSLRGWRAYLSPREMEEMGVFRSGIELLKRRENDGKYESNSFLKRKGDSYPTPLYYQHPTRTEQFYSWVTTFSKEYGNLSEDNIIIERERIKSLIKDWGVFINHGYFPRIRSGNDVINEVDGKLVIDPYFNQILQTMSEFRDEGELYITTIRELMDYWIRLEKVSFEYLQNGKIIVNNNNDVPIHGLAMAIRAREVSVNGNLPTSKFVGEDLVFWFDIECHGSAIIQICQ